jgi:hypothetical protein
MTHLRFSAGLDAGALLGWSGAILLVAEMGRVGSLRTATRADFFSVLALDKTRAVWHK